MSPAPTASISSKIVIFPTSKTFSFINSNSFFFIFFAFFTSLCLSSSQLLCCGFSISRKNSLIPISFNIHTPAKGMVPEIFFLSNIFIPLFLDISTLRLKSFFIIIFNSISPKFSNSSFIVILSLLVKT